MAILFIREYTELVRDNLNNNVQAGKEPALATQKITFSTVTQSAAFNELTKFVRIYSTADAYLEFGVAPTAVTENGCPVTAKMPEFFGVIPGQKVSVIL